MPSFPQAALLLQRRGWLAMPLGLDEKGFPKRPIVADWTNLRRENVDTLPWAGAHGLGIVLGQPSSGLAVIDLDDEDLACVAMTYLLDETRCVRTIRQRGHVYLYEAHPSRSERLTVSWDGPSGWADVLVELKGPGTQVAAPPTPGYALLNPRTPIKRHATLRDAWDALVLLLLVKEPERLRLPQDSYNRSRAPAGPPQTTGKPRWPEWVPENQRNNTLYVEAHWLREAGVPLEQALGILEARIHLHYAAPGFDWHEAQATISSAYRKGTPVTVEEVPRDGWKRYLS